MESVAIIFCVGIWFAGMLVPDLTRDILLAEFSIVSSSRAASIGCFLAVTAGLVWAFKAADQALRSFWLSLLAAIPCPFIGAIAYLGLLQSVEGMRHGVIPIVDRGLPLPAGHIAALLAINAGWVVLVCVPLTVAVVRMANAMGDEDR